jgi:hypothetical protein
LVTAERGEKQECHTGERKKSENSSVTRAREIDRNDRGDGSPHGTSVPTELEESAKYRDGDSEDEKSRRYHVSENADVRIAVDREQIKGKEQEKREKGTGRKEQADPADPVSETMAEWDH